MNAPRDDVPKGFVTALPTPFGTDGSIDLEALAGLCELQIASGTSALVVCGTTGEAPTLARHEQAIVVAAAVEQARGRVPIVAGVGANATAAAVDLARQAAAVGADMLLAVVPYYNRPSQAGLAAHFEALADATALPLLLYDVPARTGCRLADETVSRLSGHRRIVGIKDATGDVGRVHRLRTLTGPGFRLFSGDDSTVFDFLAEGGDGCISVTSNVVPGACHRLFRAMAEGRIADARRIASDLAPLTAALFADSNPVPLKYMLARQGLVSARVRLPLVELAPATAAACAAALDDARRAFPGEALRHDGLPRSAAG